MLTILLVACQPTNVMTQPIPSPFPEASTTLALSPSQTSTPTANPTLTSTSTSTNQSGMFELGEPFWLGLGKIISAVFLPGAKQVAIAWGSGVSLNLVETGEELWFQQMPTNLLAFDLQPQTQMFAAALANGSVMIFNAANGAPRRFEGVLQNAYWEDIAWSPDGETIAYQYLDYSTHSSPIYLLDIATGKITEVPNSKLNKGTNPLLIWSPDGLSITEASLNEVCPRFVDIHNGAIRMNLGETGHCYILSTLVFLPGGKTLAVAGQSEAVDILEFPSGRRITSLEGDPREVLGRLIAFPNVNGSLFYNPEGQWIASMGGYEPCYCGNPADQPYYPLVVWDLAHGIVPAQLDRAIEPLAERHRLAAAFEGDNILMLYESGEITRWEFNNPQAVETVIAHVPVRPAEAWTVRWSADGGYVAFSGQYGGVDIYSTATQQLIRRFDPPLDSPALSQGGELVALFDPDKNEEAIYQVQSGQLLRTLPATPVLMGAAFSPDGLYLVYGDGARAVIAEVASGEVSILDPTPIAPVTADMVVSRLIWSPDGQALATVFSVANGDSVGPGVIVLWKRLEDGSFEAIYHVPNVQANYTLPNQVLAIFNPSGSRIALQSMDALEAGHTILVVYDLDTRKVLQTLPEYKPGAWVNDDELLAAEAQYYCWLTHINVISGDKTIGQMSDTNDLVYAPGGIYIAQMANPSARGVVVRDWQSGKIIARAQHDALNLIDYGWSPDGRWLASIGDDGTLRTWSVVIPPLPLVNQVLNRSNLVSVMRWLRLSLEGGQPEQIADLITRNGVTFVLKWPGGAPLHGSNNSASVVRELEKALATGTPACFGYDPDFGSQPDEVMVIYQGMDLDWESAAGHYAPGEVGFVLARINQEWELIFINLVDPEVHFQFLGELNECPDF
jgi:WD40 repeat protein